MFLIEKTISYENIDTLAYKNSVKNVSFYNVSKIYTLPTITHLSFSNDFNAHIEKNILPSTVKYLSFGNTFNQLVSEDVIPSSVISLSFGDIFDRPLKKVYCHFHSPALN
jgi:hypothetical protein